MTVSKAEKRYTNPNSSLKYSIGFLDNETGIFYGFYNDTSEDEETRRILDSIILDINYGYRSASEFLPSPTPGIVAVM